MFVDLNELIDVVIYYKKVGRQYAAYNQKDFDALDLKDDKEKEKYSKVNLKMKQLTWGLYNELQENSITKGLNGDRTWNYKLYKENRLKNLVVSWDAKKKNEKGELVPVPLNPESILSLSPDIAEAILSTYDSITLLDDAAEKK